MNDFRIVRSYLRLPPEPGGMEAHIARLTAAQRAQGLEVINLYNSGHAEGANVRLIPGVRLGAIPVARVRSAMFYCAALLRADRLRDNKPTVLHVHGDLADFAYARPLLRTINGQVLSATFHGAIPQSRVHLYPAALSGYDPIFTTGKAEQQRLETALGRQVHHLPSAPLEIFFQGEVPAAPFEWDVVCVTNFFEAKRPGLILECAAKRPNLRFGIFGDGPLRADLEQRIARGNLANVVLHGRRAPADIATALSRSGVFLSTAEREGTPTAALEAMAAGLPIVITPSNTYDWLIRDGENGFALDSFDVEKIITRLDEALSEEPRRAKMGRTNRAVARQFTWENQAEKVTSLMAQRFGSA